MGHSSGQEYNTSRSSAYAITLTGFASGKKADLPPAGLRLVAKEGCIGMPLREELESRLRKSGSKSMLITVITGGLLDEVHASG